MHAKVRAVEKVNQVKQGARDSVRGEGSLGGHEEVSVPIQRHSRCMAPPLPFLAPFSIYIICPFLH